MFQEALVFIKRSISSSFSSSLCFTGVRPNQSKLCSLKIINLLKYSYPGLGIFKFFCFLLWVQDKRQKNSILMIIGSYCVAADLHPLVNNNMLTQ